MTLIPRGKLRITGKGMDVNNAQDYDFVELSERNDPDPRRSRRRRQMSQIDST